ncbi:hypothetical protein HFD98_24565 [Pseudomonas sp. EKM23D]|uniref:hypothetical protein n=1 Tax=Pseudomonas sp. EKM23D TaxID=2708062 RepID=UPI00142D5324|nr:hypothetical protein [Pseudomonas sp. EKM23D]KAF6687213.1 hypothetical protein HFD98_24565 [Pseudomonas sp. EKM23D]
MPTDREVALEQALVAIIAAAKTSGADVRQIIEKAGIYIIDSGSPYQIASNAYGVQAAQEISNAHALVLSRTE